MGRGDGIPLSPQGTTMRAKGGSFPRSTFGSPCTNEATFVPLAMLPKLRDSADPGPRVRVESARDFYNLPDKAHTGTLRLESDPHRRLHSSPIRTLVNRPLRKRSVHSQRSKRSRGSSKSRRSSVVL